MCSLMTPRQKCRFDFYPGHTLISLDNLTNYKISEHVKNLGTRKRNGVRIMKLNNETLITSRIISKELFLSPYSINEVNFIIKKFGFPDNLAVLSHSTS